MKSCVHAYVAFELEPFEESNRKAKRRDWRRAFRCRILFSHTHTRSLWRLRIVEDLRAAGLFFHQGSNSFQASVTSSLGAWPASKVRRKPLNKVLFITFIFSCDWLEHQPEHTQILLLFKREIWHKNHSLPALSFSKSFMFQYLEMFCVPN